MKAGTVLDRALAEAAVAGPWTAEGIGARMFDAVPHGPWRALARRLSRDPAPLEADPWLVRTIAAYRAWMPPSRVHLRIRRWVVATTRMGPRRWPVRPIDSVGDLAALLRLSADDLAWFADPKGWQTRTDHCPLWHYHFHWRAKPSGGARLVEAPKERTREVQRWILEHILDAIPAHDAAHGFVRGRSPRTGAEPHVGRAVLLQFDLEDFFASVPAGAVLGVFRAAGYPDAVARTLAGLSSTRAPAAVLAACPAGADRSARARQRQRLRTPHLPTGAPTSPALANLAAWRLDARLSAAAASVGATYTRYADDLTFSGDVSFRRRARRFAAWVARIVREEGYRVHPRKSRLTGRGAQQVVTGVVVNVRPALARHRYDALRAILHNCVLHGPASQNRAGHPDFRAWLTGTVAAARAIDPVRGGALWAALPEIDWSR